MDAKVMQQLKDAKEMLDAGILTQEEFDNLRANALGLGSTEPAAEEQTTSAKVSGMFGKFAKSAGATAKVGAKAAMAGAETVREKVQEKTADGSIDMSKIDFDKLNQTVNDVQKKFAEEEKHVNIVISGKTGIGKSTLINAIFGEDKVKTGTGRPVTQQTSLIESETSPVRIYDTKGFESQGAQEIMDDITNLVYEKNRDVDVDGMIGVIWYAINAESKRIDPGEMAFVRQLINEQEVPVIIILTQAKDRAATEELMEAIRNENLGVKDIIPVVAKEIEMESFGGQIIPIPTMGLDQLTKRTFDVLPDLQKRAFGNQQRVNEELKQKLFEENKEAARKSILKFTATTFAEGFVPIPLADSAMMIPTQIAMLARINAIFGVDLTKNAIATLASSLVATEAAAFAGRTIASNLLKFIPGAGTIAGGLIAGSTGAMVTSAIGLAYIKIIEISQNDENFGKDFGEVLKGIDISSILKDVDMDEVKTMVKGARN